MISSANTGGIPAKKKNNILFQNAHVLPCFINQCRNTKSYLLPAITSFSCTEVCSDNVCFGLEVANKSAHVGTIFSHHCPSPQVAVVAVTVRAEAEAESKPEAQHPTQYGYSPAPTYAPTYAPEPVYHVSSTQITLFPGPVTPHLNTQS